MSTEPGQRTPARLVDAPWRRLPAELAIAVLVWGILLLSLGATLKHPRLKEAAERPVEAQLVELPVPTPPPAAPPPPIPRPEQPQARPRLKTPPAVRPRRESPPTRPRAVSLPRAQAPAPDTTPTEESLPTAPPETPPQPASSAAPEGPPGGGRMGARVVSQPMPELPAELRDRPMSVTAVARFKVDAGGRATVTLVQATPNLRLNRWLLGVLSTWTFFPAVEDGQPVDSTLEIKIPLEVR